MVNASNVPNLLITVVDIVVELWTQEHSWKDDSKHLLEKDVQIPTGERSES